VYDEFWQYHIFQYKKILKVKCVYIKIL